MFLPHLCPHEPVLLSHLMRNPPVVAGSDKKGECISCQYVQSIVWQFCSQLDMKCYFTCKEIAAYCRHCEVGDRMVPASCPPPLCQSSGGRGLGWSLAAHLWLTCFSAPRRGARLTKAMLMNITMMIIIMYAMIKLNDDV